MSNGQDDQGKDRPETIRPEPDRPGKQAGNSPEMVKGPRIIAYNLREGERPGGPDGLKVRREFRVETGRKAGARDARQAEAIREALIWLRHHKPR